MDDATDVHRTIVVMTELVLLLSHQEGFKDALLQAGALTTVSQLIARQNLCDAVCLNVLQLACILLGNRVEDSKRMHTSQGRRVRIHQSCQGSQPSAVVPTSDLAKLGIVDRSSCTFTAANTALALPHDHQQACEFYELHPAEDAQLELTGGESCEARTQDFATHDSELVGCDRPPTCPDGQQRRVSTVLPSDLFPVLNSPDTQNPSNKNSETSTAARSDGGEPQPRIMPLSEPPDGLAAGCLQQEEQCPEQGSAVANVPESDTLVLPEAETGWASEMIMMQRSDFLRQHPPTELLQTCNERTEQCGGVIASRREPEQREIQTEGGKRTEGCCSLPLGPMVRVIQNIAEQPSSGWNYPTSPISDTPEKMNLEGLRDDCQPAATISGSSATACNPPHKEGLTYPVAGTLRKDQRESNQADSISRGMADAVAKALYLRLSEGLQLPMGRLAGEARNMVMHALCGLAEHGDGRQGTF